MRRLFLALTIIALLLPAIPQVNAEVSIDLFYNSLPGGSWVEVEGYGYGWQPDIALSDQSWRPYADGYWAYTDYGWTWISYEDFGWATYHYGRWALIEDSGWVWFPGSDLEWGPAWVSWRFGGNYCGWAPLPPRGAEIVYEGRPIGGRVDIEFDIGPAYYNFVDIRYIGEPVLRSYIYAPSYNVTYINQTVNVTNITVKNKVVYNYGPDYNVLAKHSNRQIQRLKIERQENVDVSAAAKSGALTKVQGDKLVIGAPERIQKPATQVAPPAIKSKVAKNKVEHGWRGISDENAKTQLKQKMQTEDLKKIPPPTGGAPAQPGAASPGAPAGAAASPAAPAAASPAAPAAASPFERGKRGRKGERVQPGAAPEVSPGAETSPMQAPTAPGRGKRKGRPGEFPGEAPGVSPAAEGSPSMPERGRHRGRREAPSMSPGPAGTYPEGAETAPSQGKYPGKRGRPMQPDYEPGTGGEQQGAAQGTGQGGKHKARRLEPSEAPPGAAGSPEAGTPYREGRDKRQGPGTYPPQQGAAPAASQPGAEQPVEGKPEHKKEKRGQATPAPMP